MKSGRELSDFPTHIGRYRVTGRIAAGGFATVLRARDEDLDRDVAIKVPHADLHLSDLDLENFLSEARILASLDHPGIVPVYDVGCTEEGLYYLVTKLVEGTDLKTRLKAARLAPPEAVEIAACVAEALHCAHRRELVHRDVKPGNILLDSMGRPMLIDFGLALKDADLGSGPTVVGTPLYMSPEQARRRGHEVDPRTDIYSLGVVFYEMLTGRTPFRGDSLEELMDRICHQEPKPPRQIDDTIPLELERIWGKATAKKVVERYSTAKDLAEDLRVWRQGFAGSTCQGQARPAPVTLDANAYASTVAYSGAAAETVPPVPVPRRRSYRWVIVGLLVVAAGGLFAFFGWPLTRAWLFPAPTYPAVSAGRRLPLFDGLSVAPPAWITSEGSWAAAQDTEGSRVLAGRGVIRRDIPELADFRLLLGVNLHEAAAIEVQFAVERHGDDNAKRFALRVSRETGIELGRRAGERGAFEPIGPAVPFKGARNSTRYHEVRVERVGSHWWAFFDGKPVGCVNRSDEPVRSEFLLVADGGKAWFSDLELDELIPAKP